MILHNSLEEKDDDNNISIDQNVGLMEQGNNPQHQEQHLLLPNAAAAITMRNDEERMRKRPFARRRQRHEQSCTIPMTSSAFVILICFICGWIYYTTTTSGVGEYSSLSLVATHSQRALQRLLNGGEGGDFGAKQDESYGYGPPSKGDKGCWKFIPGMDPPDLPPCHEDEGYDEDGEDGGNNFKPSIPPDEGFDSGIVGVPSFGGPRAPENIVDLKVFVALDPEVPSVAHGVANLLTFDLNTTIENMNFFLEMPEGFEVPDSDDKGDTSLGDFDQGNPNNNDDENRGPPVDDDFSSPPEEPPFFVQKQAQPPPMIVELNRTTPREDQFNMIYIRVDTRIARRKDNVWWWQHDINYLCYWGDDSTPVGKDKMREIGRNITGAVKDDLERLTTLLRTVTDSSIVILDVFPRGDVDGSTKDPTVIEGTLAPESFPERLNARQWTWSRYLGISVFLGTLSSLILASQISGIRRRVKVRKQVWGNLASEEGVKELLSTGWVLRDDRMEVYDKERMGYRDDDSMLIGGYEQREPGPGTEIVAPTLTTHEETSTRGPSTTPRDVSSSRQEDVSSRPEGP